MEVVSSAEIVEEAQDAVRKVVCSSEVAAETQDAVL